MRYNLFILFALSFIGSLADWLLPSGGHFIHAEAIAAAAAIAAVASLIGGLFSSSSSSSASRRAANASLQATRETNEANYKMFQEANQFSLDMWNRENEYNTPSAQVQRLQEAGLNPYLMLGGSGTTGNASSLTSQTAPTNQTPDLSSLQNVQSPLGILGNGLSSALNGLAAGIQMYDASKKAQVSASDAKFADSLNAAQLGLTKAKGSLTYNQARGALSDAIVSERTVGSRIISNQLDNELKGYQKGILSTQEQDSSRLFMERLRNDYYAVKTLNDIEMMRSTVKGLDLDNQFKDKQVKMYDRLQEKSIELMGSTIKKNFSDINRNNYLNRLTDSQTTAQDLLNGLQAVNYNIQSLPEVQQANIQKILSSALEAGPQSIGEYAWSQINSSQYKRGSGKWLAQKAWAISLLPIQFVERALGGAVDSQNRSFSDTHDTVVENFDSKGRLRSSKHTSTSHNHKPNGLLRKRFK